MENSQMDRRLKGLIAATGVAVIGTVVYLAADRFLSQDEALFGDRAVRAGECDDANATMDIVRRGEKVPPHMMSHKQAEFVLTTMACKP
jgi:hypothetical protein